jgi:SAM-dependent methyltransferase
MKFNLIVPDCAIEFPRRIVLCSPPCMGKLRDIQSYSGRLQTKKEAEKYARRFETGARKRIDDREQRAVRSIFKGLPDVRSILDVPSGAGRFLRTLASGGRQVIEMDVALEILAFAREKAGRDRVPVSVLQGDASQLPLADESVDCVFCNRLLHHIVSGRERSVILREFHRVSRRWVVVSFFDYRGLGGLRQLLKRLKGRKASYEDQPTREEFTVECAASGFAVKAVVSTGGPWVSQKYFVMEKA